MTQEIIKIVVILFIILVLVVPIIVRAPKNKSKKLVKEFFDDIRQILSVTITGIIESYDASNYTSAEEFEIDLLNTIYDNCWKYVQQTISDKYPEDIALILSIAITRDKVERFVDAIVEDKKIGIMEKFAASNLENSTIEEDDKKLADEYGNQEKYVEESNNNELAPAEAIEPTEEQKAALNPPKDEEESYDKNDESMEVIEDDTYILVKTDKNGIKLYYEVEAATGKKKKIAKVDALSSGKEIREE